MTAYSQNLLDLEEWSSRPSKGIDFKEVGPENEFMMVVNNDENHTSLVLQEIRLSFEDDDLLRKACAILSRLEISFARCVRSESNAKTDQLGVINFLGFPKYVDHSKEEDRLNAIPFVRAKSYGNIFVILVDDENLNPSEYKELASAIELLFPTLFKSGRFIISATYDFKLKVDESIFARILRKFF